MKMKIIGIFVFTLLIATAFPLIEVTTIDSPLENQILLGYLDGCAGAIATGSVVKDGRSIFWKNRHYYGENNKPFFYQGSVYKYYGIGQSYTQCLMGINEKGLAMGGFQVEGPLDNWEYISDGPLVNPSDIQNYLLGNFDNVYDAAMFAALHIAGNYQYGIISSEPGVGAILAVSEYDGTPRTNITWINNSYAPLANAFYCDGDHDWDGSDIRIDNMLDDIVTNGGINGDFKIDWEEVCQRCGKNVNEKEEGNGTFYCQIDITNPMCVSGFVAVSGNPDFDGAANIGWLAMGRQPLVGIWLPLAASCLTEPNDIPSEYSDGGGIEDYVDLKVFYATMGAGQGSSKYSCERVREILSVTNENESYMFNIYDEIMDDIPPGATPSEVKSILYSFVEEIVPYLITEYESLNHRPDAPIINGPTNVKTGEKYDYTFNVTDPDGNQIKYNISWGDGSSAQTEYVDSGVDITFKHEWKRRGKYTITAKANDIYDYEGLEGTLEIIVPRNKPMIYNLNLLNWLFARFPFLEMLFNNFRSFLG